MSHVCPWWGGDFLDNRLRRLIHDPEMIVGPYVKPGMTVMDVGCGMRLFSIPMARMVGDEGRVIAVDLRQKMLGSGQGRLPWPTSSRFATASGIALAAMPKPTSPWLLPRLMPINAGENHPSNAFSVTSNGN